MQVTQKQFTSSDIGYHGKSLDRLSKEELIREKYRGIRPALGYPACPDHTEKAALFELLEAPALGITLTESFAMQPGASVSGGLSSSSSS